jgi:ABC-type branched-subunit amino acid transport system substrate-binding protein
MVHPSRCADRVFLRAAVTTVATRRGGTMKIVRSVLLIATAVVFAAVPAGAVGRQASGSTNGVTADEIELGYPIIDFAALKDVGVNIDRGDTQKIFDVLTDQLNADGGINGRKVHVDVEKYSVLNPAEAEAVCTKLTQDEKVFAVIGAFDGVTQSADKCVTDHKTFLIGGSPDVATAKKTPWISQTASQERQARVFVQLMAKQGILKGKTIGISTDPTQEQITKKVIVPALKKAGFPAKVVVVDDGPPGDTAAADANWDVFAEKFKSAGVNHVILVGTEAAGGLTRLLDRNVKATVSSPTNGLVEGLGTSQTQRPPSAYDGYYTITGLTPDEIFADPPMQKCVKTFEKANPSITVKKPSAVAEGETDWATGILTACGQLGIFQTVAQEAGKNLTNQSVIDAVRGMTTNFALPGSPYNTFGPAKFDANNSFRLGVFDHTLGKTGGVKPIGTLQNLP